MIYALRFCNETLIFYLKSTLTGNISITGTFNPLH
jgi:hypothetical protein